MSLAWLLCLALGAAPALSPPSDPTPPALSALLEEHPDLRPHHQGYLKELARFPALAAAESAWWQTRAQPELRALDNQFEERVGADNVATSRFDAFYDHLTQNPALRDVVENLLRTELEQAQGDPTLAVAIQYLRAHPELAMRFLQNPASVRPLPEPLRAAYDSFLKHPEWMSALRDAFGKVLNQPEAYQAVLPWWEQLEALGTPSDGESPALPTELYQHPRQLWLWHLRNVNLARNAETRPWIRYWSRLIHRDPVLAQQYGPFITDLLQEPERMRGHLARLQDKQTAEAEGWPPRMKPPTLPPLDMNYAVQTLKRGMNQPVIETPERPGRLSPQMPTRPTPPRMPEFPTLGKPGDQVRQTGPVFPTFPTMPRPDGIPAPAPARK